MDFATLQLQTNLAVLRPMTTLDFTTFHKLAQDEDAWKYFSLNLAAGEQLHAWMDTALKERDMKTRIPFTIVDQSTGEIAGSSSLGNISFHDQRLEIGWSWLGNKFRGTGLNRHCKFAMMQYTFEQLHFERIEFKTDVLNERAKKGLQNIGGQEEGILRSHMTMWNNRRRDSVYFSVLKKEWPQLKQTIFKDITYHEDH